MTEVFFWKEKNSVSTSYQLIQLFLSFSILSLQCNQQKSESISNSDVIMYLRKKLVAALQRT